MSLANFNESKVGECGWSWLVFSNSKSSLNAVSKWIICSSLRETTGHCRPPLSYYNYYCNLIALDERGVGHWSSGTVQMICNVPGHRDFLWKVARNCKHPSFPTLFGEFIKGPLLVYFNITLTWFIGNTYYNQSGAVASEEGIWHLIVFTYWVRLVFLCSGPIYQPGMSS